MQSAIITKKDITIASGIVAPDNLEEFLAKLSPNMPWAICSHTDKCEFIKDRLPALKYLERMRKFGDGGDFEIRLDGQIYYWRYIGPVGQTFFNDYGPRDFWQEANIEHLYVYEDKLFLWGKREKDGKYHENKVAAAVLDYPVTLSKDRVAIKTRIYTYYGRPQFAWYVGLEG